MKKLLFVCSLLASNQVLSDTCAIDESTLSYSGDIHYTLSAGHPSGSIGSGSNSIVLKAFSLENEYTLLKECKLGSFTNNPDEYDMYYSSEEKPFNGYDKEASYRNTVYEGVFTEQTGIYASNGKNKLINLISEDINSNQCWKYPANFSGGDLNRNDNFWTYFCPKLELINNIDKIIKQRSDSCMTGSTGTVATNLDIHMPSLSYDTLLGKQNIWADLEYKGTNSEGQHIWGLKDFGVNQ